MSQSLAKSLRSNSKRSEIKVQKEAAEAKEREEKEWKISQKAEADLIIKDLPAKLRKAAIHPPRKDMYTSEGPRRYKVLTLDPRQGEDGVVANLRGAAAHIRDWCLTNSLQVELALDIDSGCDWSGYHMIIVWE